MLGRHVIILRQNFLGLIYIKNSPFYNERGIFSLFVFYSKIQPFVKSTFTGFKSLM